MDLEYISKLHGSICKLHNELCAAIIAMDESHPSYRRMNALADQLFIAARISYRALVEYPSR